MAVNEIRTIQEGLAHGDELRGVEIVDQFLARRVHLGANIERQVEFSTQGHHFIQLLDH